ncbi:MAG: DUF255 domain-containing protein [Bacteroidales bacterium]|jgi:uncharacterized protein YyaL (SSP411 family)|nr:DUF255 domain-containing protein [Bacteroidales bacterium]MDD4057331.1 DUF255 domain-containing protein [Bacteroidales bacterium]
MSKICSPYIKLLSGKGIEWNYTLTAELLSEAKKEDKLIFLHIGYMSNVKVREGSVKLFSDNEVASLLNDNFICIVEDKDDNPESFLVALDMLLLNNDYSYGPMNLFIMPDRRPILCSSETDPKKFLITTNTILNAKLNKRELLDKLADELSHRTKSSGIITDIAEEPKDELTTLHNYVKNWHKTIFKSDFIKNFKPYTPNPGSLYTIVEYLKHFPDKELEHSIISLLEDLQFSPLFDPIDGGFFRQAEDYTCREPLYEKTLEDNSQYMILYSAAWNLFRRESFRETVLHIYNFVNRELLSPSGGYYSNTTISDNANLSVYFSCSLKELEHLFPSRYQEISVALGLDTRENESSKQSPVRNSDTYHIITRDELESLRARRKEHRGYLKDTRIITSYNSQLIKALTISSKYLENEDLLEDAISLFDYIINNNINSKGRLLRYTCCATGCRFGFLSDYAAFIDSSAELYKNTQKREFKEIAIKYLDFVIDNFYKPENGMFSKSEKSADLPVVPFKRESNIDLIKPSANSVIAGVMIELFKLTGEKRYLQIAGQQIGNILPSIGYSGPLLSNWAHKLMEYGLISK